MIKTYKHKKNNGLVFAKKESHLTVDHVCLPDFDINDYAEAEYIKHDVDEVGYSLRRLDQLHLRGSIRIRAQWFRDETELEIPAKEVWY